MRCLKFKDYFDRVNYVDQSTLITFDRIKLSPKVSKTFIHHIIKCKKGKLIKLLGSYPIYEGYTPFLFNNKNIQNYIHIIHNYRNTYYNFFILLNRNMTWPRNQLTFCHPTIFRKQKYTFHGIIPKIFYYSSYSFHNSFILDHFYNNKK